MRHTRFLLAVAVLGLLLALVARVALAQHVFTRIGGASTAILQPYQLPADRLTTWNPGLNSVGGIPSDSWTVFNPSGLNPIGGGQDDSRAIQTVINDASAVAGPSTPQVVKLNAGTFTVNGSPQGFIIPSYVAVRGAGPTETILNKTNGSVAGRDHGCIDSSPLASVGLGIFYGHEDGATSTNLAQDGHKGDASVTLTSGSGFAIGQIVLLDQDEYDQGSWQAMPNRRGSATSAKIWATDRTTYKLTKYGDISSITETGSTAHVVTAAPNSLLTNDLVDINNVTPSQYNGSYLPVTVQDSTHFAYPVPGGVTGLGPGSGGYVGDPQDDPVHAYVGANPWFARSKRQIAEVKEITAVDGTVITFSTPLHQDFFTAGASQLTRYTGSNVHAKNAGLEEVAAFNGCNGGVVFSNCAYCWIKHVEIKNWTGEGIQMTRCFRCEVRQAYIHHAAFISPGGGAYATSCGNGSSENLWEDNIFIEVNKVMVERACGAGTVYGYNFADDGWINYAPGFQEVGINGGHFVGSHRTLFEGNYSFNADADNTHGGTVYHVYLRNWLTGSTRDHVQTDNLRAAGLNFGNNWQSFVGNVLGKPGCCSGWVYENYGQGPPRNPFAASAIWKMGYQSGQWDQQADPMVLKTILRDGNYDFINNAQMWHGIGAPGGSSTPHRIIPNSYYLNSKPAFFGENPWPWVDPTTGTTYTLPAKDRYDSGLPNGGCDPTGATKVCTLPAPARFDAIHP